MCAQHCSGDRTDVDGAAIEGCLTNRPCGITGTKESKPPASIFFRIVSSPSHLGLLSSTNSVVCRDEERVSVLFALVFLGTERSSHPQCASESNGKACSRWCTRID